MSPARLLSLVLRYPHPTALARRVHDRSLFVALRRLEALGLVRRDRGEYRLTRRGRRELATARALTRLLARPHS
jgi:Mn-dependent DtxR family transcriptional regulator